MPILRQLGDRLCGRVLPQNVSSSTEKLRITFRSNSDTKGDGFNVSCEFIS